MAKIDKFRAWFEDGIDEEAARERFARERAHHGWCKRPTMSMLNYAVTECMEPGEVYLEIGTFLGTSLLAALKENDKIAEVIDPLEHATNSGPTFDQWTKAIHDFGIADRVNLHRIPCEDFVDELPTVGVYYYDGNHDSGHTYEGLKKFTSCLADEAIIFVDCYNIYGGHAQGVYPGHLLDIKKPVKTDVDRWVSENPDTIEFVGVTPWWNGQAVMYYRR